MAARLVGIREELSTALWKIMQGERVEGDEKQVTNMVNIQAISRAYLTMQLSQSAENPSEKTERTNRYTKLPRKALPSLRYATAFPHP